jgi:putative SOS response-associated peptidase YedK
MCGRYAITLPPEAMVQLFDLKGEIPPFQPSWNVCPTQPIPVIFMDAAPKRTATFMRWGFHPAWMKEPPGAKSMINARAETAAEKPFFRNAYKRRRAIIPMDGYYEWRREGAAKTPFYIHAADGAPLAAAGLWETWSNADGSELDGACILTTGANKALAAIHDRMPVFLPKDSWDLWLDPHADLEPISWMLQAAPDDFLVAHQVSVNVNSPRHNGPSLIEAV